MAARVAKNIIRALLREKMKQLKVPSSEPYRQLVLQLFNLFSGHHRLSSKFWTATTTAIRRTVSPDQQKGEETTQRPAQEEDRGLEYYIYQQNQRRKSSGKSIKTEKLSCFRSTWDHNEKFECYLHICLLQWWMKIARLLKSQLSLKGWSGVMITPQIQMMRLTMTSRASTILNRNLWFCPRGLTIMMTTIS